MGKWAGILGIILIISGVLSAISGVFFFIVGAIPGIITIVLGVKLRETKKYADELLASESHESLNPMINSLASFFKIQGVLIIVIFVIMVLSFLLGVAGIMMTFMGLTATG